jgi:2-amino-4-hydroxy-6-hydroxymethyldihydropteridine diphosphokinase
MTRAFIGLGSNLGDRLKVLQRAVTSLGEIPGVQLCSVSSVYETEPVGPAAQAWFLNAVAAISTSLSPMTLLNQTQAIERALGRETTYHWGPRSIDLDILLYGDLQVKTAPLTIPHAELCHRAFVLVPLLELDSSLVLPDGAAISTCLSRLTPPQQVKLYAPAAALASSAALERLPSADRTRSPQL